MRLKDKVAVIAGAGGGMGTAVPMLFAQEGAKVVLAARRPEPLEALVARIRAAGGEAAWVTGDLTTAAGAQRVMEGAVEQYGKLDILYNNLGDSAAGNLRLGDTPEETWDYLTNINLKTAYLCARYALPAMLRSGGGVIIHVSASYDIRQRGNGGYGAAKAGLLGLTQNMAREYRQDNIRIVCLCPNGIGGSFEGDRVGLPPQALGRRGTPEDVAYAALYLASAEAAWITGLVLAVDGGNEVALPAP